MAVSAKPRRKYRPKAIARNPVDVAIRRARKITRDEIEEVMRPIHASFAAMRQGVGTEDQWCVLAGCVELALSIEHQGVVRGLNGHLKAAEAALAAIKARAMDSGRWRPTALYFQEIGALDDFTWLHKVQLQELSEREWRLAHDRAMTIVLAAGVRVVDVRELKVDQAQLQLEHPTARVRRVSEGHPQ